MKTTVIPTIERDGSFDEKVFYNSRDDIPRILPVEMSPEMRKAIPNDMPAVEREHYELMSFGYRVHPVKDLDRAAMLKVYVHENFMYWEGAQNGVEARKRAITDYVQQNAAWLYTYAERSLMRR